MEAEPGRNLRVLRTRCGLSIRRLAEQSGVTAGMISCIERDKSSPSIVTLKKILAALGTDLATFFASEEVEQEGPVFPREKMKAINDAERSYTFVFPKRDDVQVEMLDECMRPTPKRPAFEKLKCDVAGYVLSGRLALEIKGEQKKTLRPGDGFYIRKSTEHRGFALDDEPVRLVTVYYPARY